MCLLPGTRANLQANNTLGNGSWQMHTDEWQIDTIMNITVLANMHMRQDSGGSH